VKDTRPHPGANHGPKEWPRIDLNADLGATFFYRHWFVPTGFVGWVLTTVERYRREVKSGCGVFCNSLASSMTNLRCSIKRQRSRALANPYILRVAASPLTNTLDKLLRLDEKSGEAWRGTVNAVDARPTIDTVLKELLSGGASVTHHSVWSDHVGFALVRGMAGRIHNPPMRQSSRPSSRLVSHN
jgi:hypothetical protein